MRLPCLILPLVVLVLATARPATAQITPSEPSGSVFPSSGPCASATVQTQFASSDATRMSDVWFAWNWLATVRSLRSTRAGRPAAMQHAWIVRIRNPFAIRAAGR